MMSQDESDQSIYASATACSRLFDQYIGSSTDPAKREDHDVALELFGRFELWAAYVGAFASPKLSLDARLVDHPEIKEMVLELLIMIQRNLTQELRVHLESENGSHSPTGGDKVQGPDDFNDSLIIGLKAVSAALKRLHSLSVAIRRSVPKTYQQVACTGNRGLPTHTAEEQCYIDFVRHRFPHASASLVSQIGRSIHVRGRSMYYQQRHNRKTQEVRAKTEPTSAKVSKTADADEKRATLQRLAPSIRPDGHQDTVPMSETNASRLVSEVFRKRFMRLTVPSVSHVSRGSSVRDNEDDRFDYPKKPNPEKNTPLIGLCQLCLEPLELNMLTDMKWREHVDHDIEPYVCLSESCKDPLCFFTTSSEWKEHMQRKHTMDWPWQIHTALWQCDLDCTNADADTHETEFYDKESFLAHLSAAHSGTLTRAQILARGRRARTIQVRDAFTCPLCDCQPEEIVSHISERPYDLLFKHIARHLKAFAFTSLSFLDSIEYGSGPSDSGKTGSASQELGGAEDASARDDNFDDIPPTECENDPDSNPITAVVEDSRFSAPEPLTEPVVWPILARRDIENSHDPILEKFAAAKALVTFVPDEDSSDAGRNQDETQGVLGYSSSSSAMLARLRERSGFSRSPTGKWHDRLLSIAQDFLAGFFPGPSLYIDSLRTATDTFLEAAHLLPHTVRCDSELTRMVVDHHNRFGGDPQVATLASIHATSELTGLALIRDLRYEVFYEDPAGYLNCLVNSYCANRALVSCLSDFAAYTIHLQSLPVAEYPHKAAEIIFDMLFNLQMERAGLIILPVTEIIHVLQKMHFSSAIQREVDDRMLDRNYHQLYTYLSWARKLKTRLAQRVAPLVATELVPDWQTWASWEPNYARINRWQHHQFTQSHWERLYPVLDLEGPMRDQEDIPPRLRDVQPHLRDPILSILDKVLSLPMAAQVPGLELLIFLVVESTVDLDADLVKFAEVVIDTKDGLCIQAVLDWLSTSTSPRGSTTLSRLCILIDSLGPHSHLQTLIRKDAASDIRETTSRLAAEFAELVEDGSTNAADNLILEIAMLYRATKAASWLYTSLPDPLLQKFRKLPIEEFIFQTVTVSNSPARSAGTAVLDYVQVVLDQRTGDRETLFSGMEELYRQVS